MVIQIAVQNQGVAVFRTSGLSQAMFIRNLLERLGIKVNLSYETLPDYHGKRMDCCGDVSVIVPAENADEAHDLLKVQFPFP
jgi:hypothetical protein